MEDNISEMRDTVARMDENILNIKETLKGLCCRDHLAKIEALEKENDREHAALDKKQDRVVTVWATVSGGVIFVATVVAIVAHFAGMIK